MKEAEIIDVTKRIPYRSYRCPVCARTTPCLHDNLYVDEFPKEKK